MSDSMLKTELENKFAELHTLRDDIRVQLHLASMDAKTRWAEIEPRIAQFERTTADTVTEAARAGLTEAIKQLLHFRDSLPKKHA